MEIPVIYPHGQQKASPKSILKLSRVAGDLVARARGLGQVRVIEVEPGQWKGQIPKHIMHEDRIIPALTLSELSIVGGCLASVPASYQNNVLDALGLWLQHRGRI